MSSNCYIGPALFGFLSMIHGILMPDRQTLKCLIMHLAAFHSHLGLNFTPCSFPSAGSWSYTADFTSSHYVHSWVSVPLAACRACLPCTPQPDVLNGKSKVWSLQPLCPWLGPILRHGKDLENVSVLGNTCQHYADPKPDKSTTRKGN
jgi:hypothetical protein